MKTLVILLLCIIDIVFCTVFTIIIPRKIQSPIRSIIITIVGVCLSIALLLIVAILGKTFDMMEETKSFILITFAINAFINTIYLFMVRNHWIWYELIAVTVAVICCIVPQLVPIAAYVVKILGAAASTAKPILITALPLLLGV